jgi:hypothetical protein
VRRSGDDDEPLFAAELCERRLVQFDDREVIPAPDSRFPAFTSRIGTGVCGKLRQCPFRCLRLYTAKGNVSGTSPASQSAVRSRGSTARVSSKCSTASN